MRFVRSARAAVVAAVSVAAVGVLAAPATANTPTTVSWSAAVEDTPDAAGEGFNSALVPLPAPVTNVSRVAISTWGYGHNHGTAPAPVVLNVTLVPSGQTVWSRTLDPFQTASLSIDVPVSPLSVPVTGVLVSSAPGQAQTFHNFYGSDSVTVWGSPVGPATAPQCSDGIDNDFNGRTDYPNDPGCSSPSDPTEAGSGSSCQNVGGVPVCTSVVTGTVFQQLSVTSAQIGTAAVHNVAGEIDIYAFPLPNGATLTVPCVVLKVNTTTADGCKAAGGTYVSTVAYLVNQTVNQPSVTPVGSLATMTICNARYTVTVAGAGVSNFPAYAPC